MTMLRKGVAALSILNSDLCKDWDYEKNAPIMPDDFSHGSDTKVSIKPTKSQL